MDSGGGSGSTGGAPTARFLQARITTLSTTLIKRLENIFAAALPPDPSNPSPAYQPSPSTTNGTLSVSNAPALTTTAIDQFQLDVESTALVRAAEEIMVLTRQLKDLWLFGGLDTLRNDQDGAGFLDEKAEEDKMIVEDFIKSVLFGTMNGTGSGQDVSTA